LPEFPLEVYVYRTPNGLIGDFRSYLDGRDHSFDDHRPLPQSDPRWEKIVNLRDPVTDQNLGGQIEFVGKSSVGWHELLAFPIVWDREYEAVSA
jgi:hypothetical protein